MAIAVTKKTEISPKLLTLETQWHAAWPRALRTWSPYVTLHDPTFYKTANDAELGGMQDTFAQISMINLDTQIDLTQVIKFKVEDFDLEILAHEIGHHILCPGSLVDLARLIAILKPIFGDQNRATLMENLFTDLLVNDRLFMSRKLRMPDVYKRICEYTRQQQGDTPLWTIYMRVYETLWKLPRGSLAGDQITDRIDLDAGIAARIIRLFPRRWFSGAKKIAYVFLPYFPEPLQMIKIILPNWDFEKIGDVDPKELSKHLYGLTQISDDEMDAVSAGAGDVMSPPNTRKGSPRQSEGQRRTPAQFGDLLASLGIKIPPSEMAIQYYRELASPALIPFPAQNRKSKEQIMEGTEPWELGDDIEDIDWQASLLHSPTVFPGLTTRKRVYGTDVGDEVARFPENLDLYVDCSGSMPNPHYQLSYLTLAAVIMALSALRAGAKVQATLWADYGRFLTTKGFIDDERRLLEIITADLSGGTGFPLNILRDTYKTYAPDKPPAHILVISDNGVDTMLQKDEYKTPGEQIIKEALVKCRGGGTLALNYPAQLANFSPKIMHIKELGYEIYRVSDWAQLESFAREFSEKKYGDTAGGT